MRNRVSEEALKRAVELVEKGKSVREACEIAGIGRTTYYRYGNRSGR